MLNEDFPFDYELIHGEKEREREREDYEKN